MIKQEIMELISNLPDNITIDDVMYRLFILDKHKKAMEAIKNDDVYSVDEVKGMLLSNDD